MAPCHWEISATPSLNLMPCLLQDEGWDIAHVPCEGLRDTGGVDNNSG